MLVRGAIQAIEDQYAGRPAGVLILDRLDGPSDEHSDRLLTYGQVAPLPVEMCPLWTRRYYTDQYKPTAARRTPRANGAQNALYSATATAAVSGVIR